MSKDAIHKSIRSKSVPRKYTSCGAKPDYDKYSPLWSDVTCKKCIRHRPKRYTKSHDLAFKQWWNKKPSKKR